MTAVLVPDIGDATDVTVIEVHVAVGDTVAVDDPVVTLESDKATMDVPSTAAGVVRSVSVEVGAVVAEGSPLIEVEEGADADAAEPAPAAATTATAAAGQPVEASPAPPEAAGSVTVAVPDIGDATDVTVIEVHVAVGDTVAVDDPVVTLESDKATMDVPSTAAGTVSAVRVAVGDAVSEGAALVELSAHASTDAAAAVSTGAGEASAERPAPAPEEAPGSSAAAETAADDGTVHASPLARRLARELGVDLRAVPGSAPNGRISREDVLAAAEATGQAGPSTQAGPAAAPDDAGPLAALPPWPQVDFERFGEVEVVPLTRIKKLVGANLHRNWVRIPHVTHHDEADVTELEAFRVRTNEEQAKAGVKLTMVALLLKASVAALREHPQFNASLRGDELVIKRYHHLGVAVDTPSGLVVPVVRDVDRKGLLELATELAEVSARARDGKLTPADMQGATFTISSLGGIGGTGFTPIVNAPEVAILGVTRTAMRPVWDGSAFLPRLMLPLSLSYDHRVIDGAAAARFTRTLAGVLEDLRRVLL